MCSFISLALFTVQWLFFQAFQSEPVLPVHMARPDQVDRTLKSLYREAQIKLKGKDLELLIVILPDNNGALYGTIVSYVFRAFFASSRRWFDFCETGLTVQANLNVEQVI